MSIRIPINLKILFVTITTLLVATTYLIKQSVDLQSQEKISSAYQSQLSETNLLADKFNALLHNSLNTLKQVGSLDWTATTDHNAAVQTLLKNQKDLTRVYVVSVPLVDNGEPLLLYKSSNSHGYVESNNVLRSVVGRLELLVKNQVQVVNLSGDKPEAQAGVLIPDVSSLSEGKLIVLVGFVDTDNLFTNVNYEVTVAKPSGELIFSSEHLSKSS